MELKARSIISASGLFVGLLMPLRFPEFFWQILFAVVIGGSLLLFWIFDEKPNWIRLKEDWFTIVFLSIFILSATVFAYLVPHPFVQALLLGGIGFSSYFIYLVASRLKRGYKPSLFLRNIISIITILGIFFSVSDVLRYGLVLDVRLGAAVVIFLTFLTVFVISEFLFEAQGFDKSLLYSLVLSFAITEIVWISSYWLVNYPYSTRLALSGVPLPAVLGSVFYYLFWGLSHHRLEGTLTRKVIIEYILISTVFTGILLVTAKWLP